MWFWLFKYVLMGPILRLIGRPKVTGLENLPAHGPAILASNHLAVVDSFYLPLMIPRRMYFLAKSEYFTGTGFKGAFQRWFFSSTGQIPIDRTGADAADAARFKARHVVPGRRMLPHHDVHRRRHQNGLVGGKQKGCRQIVCHAGRHPRQQKTAQPTGQNQYLGHQPAPQAIQR